MNLTCAICSDLLMPSDDIHMTPCGHAFHYACLLQWLQRSKTCPQCRNKCHEKSLIKAYFNVAVSDDSTAEDSATLLHKLDNLTLAVREKDKKIKEYEDKAETEKGDRKKMKKIIKGLEELVQKKDFTLMAYTQELDMLRLDRAHMLKLQKELKELKSKMDLMSTVEHVITATAQEVEEMIANDNDLRTLAVLVASLKRELKVSEGRCHEMRDRIKFVQKDLSNEKNRRKDLEEKLSTADSELYRLEQEVKRLEKSTAATADASSESDSIVLNTPDQPPKRKRGVADLDQSTPMSDKVRNIMASDSPYLNIKASSIGLVPIMRAGLSSTATAAKSSSAASGTLTKTQSDLSDRFSIMRNPRLAARTTALPPNKNLVFNGLGGSERKENFPGFPVRKETLPAAVPVKPSTSTTVSLSKRVKTGTLTRHPSTTKFSTAQQMMDDFLLPDDDD
uniref:E3 ubiquitin-protein ligase TRAIP n=1 Tax=Culex pipiens TaxID=7175 RepID=A0A8D8ES84_CULPI